MTTPSPAGRDRVAARPDPSGASLWWRWAFVGALAVQLGVLYVPRAPAGPSVNGFDKVVHLTIFAVPVLLALVAGIRARWVLVILAVHAPISELVQHFLLPHRSGDVFDVLADLSGVLIGALAYLVWSRRQRW